MRACCAVVARRAYSVQVIMVVMMFDAIDQLNGEHSDSFEGEFAIALVVQRLERVAQQLHHHDVHVRIAAHAKPQQTTRTQVSAARQEITTMYARHSSSWACFSSHLPHQMAAGTPTPFCTAR